jgi:hypothetical protein
MTGPLTEAQEERLRKANKLRLEWKYRERYATHQGRHTDWPSAEGIQARGSLAIAEQGHISLADLHHERGGHGVLAMLTGHDDVGVLSVLGGDFVAEGGGEGEDSEGAGKAGPNARGKKKKKKKKKKKQEKEEEKPSKQRADDDHNGEEVRRWDGSAEREEGCGAEGVGASPPPSAPRRCTPTSSKKQHDRLSTWPWSPKGLQSWREDQQPAEYPGEWDDEPDAEHSKSTRRRWKSRPAAASYESGYESRPGSSGSRGSRSSGVLGRHVLAADPWIEEEQGGRSQCAA